MVSLGLPGGSTGAVTFSLMVGGHGSSPTTEAVHGEITAVYTARYNSTVQWYREGQCEWGAVEF